MSSIPLEELLEPISAESPCGAGLDQDPQGQELDVASQGKPEQRMGESVIPARDPDWSQVKALALDICRRSHDLRVGVLLARALAHTDGLLGLADGLRLLAGYVENYWESLHPEPEDPAAFMRVNALSSLADREASIVPIQQIPLVEARGLGRFSLRDILVAQGEITAAGEEEVPTAALIEGAFDESDINDLRVSAEAAHESLAALNAIDSEVEKHLGAANTPDLTPITHLLSQISEVFSSQLARRGVVGPENASADPAPVTSAGSAPGGIRGPADVIRALDEISKYYKENEPSSPLPHLMARAKRLVNASFAELLRDIAPGGLDEFRNVTGIGDSGDDS